MSSGLKKQAHGRFAPAMRIMARLKRKGVRYWATALIVFVLATLASPVAYHGLHLDEQRSRYFQWLLDNGPRAVRPLFVGLIVIDDKIYWGKDFAGRAPIKRGQLAKIIGAVPKHVQVIAIDFDMRLPDSDSMEIPTDYDSESCELIQAIADVVNANRRVVLAVPISFNAHHEYRRDSDIYQANGLCVPPGPASRANACSTVKWGENAKSRISCGHISLPDDMLVIPPTLRLTDGTTLDSFSVALARAQIPERVAEVIDTTHGRVRYGNFMPEERFIDAHVRLTADQLPDLPPSDPKPSNQGENAPPTDRKPSVQNETLLLRSSVIIGGSWRAFAKDRGPWIDRHETPIGLMPGMVLHANFAEAILDSRAFPALPLWFLEAIEIALAVVAAAVFALSRSLVAKLGWLAGMLAALLFFQWLWVHAFGVFFNAFLPIVGLALHSICEGLIGHHEGEPPSRHRGREASSAGA